MDFGKYIRNQRLKHAFTIRDIVEMSGDSLDKTTISRIERNERKVSLKAAYVFSELYDIDLKAMAKKALGEEVKVRKVRPEPRKRGRKKGRPSSKKV
jgi:transcriptional regulator with XRE-family HTH domain